MIKTSAGLLMWRDAGGVPEVLLGHPGGPAWSNKDTGVWSIPKGELHSNEDPLAAAQREFQEETSLEPNGPFVPLGTVTLKSGKIVHAWAFQGDCDPSAVRSNTCITEWPPHSGKTIEVPELDRAEFWPLVQARLKIWPAQAQLLDRFQDYYQTR